jgi:Lsr2
MAQKVQVILVDDLDGGEAEESVTFALDGVNYEIDLSAANAEALRGALAEWVGHARKVGGRSGRGRPAGRAKAAAKADLTDVRAWARDNGYKVSDRGRVSSEVMTAYEGAH